ncbi:histone-lysine N-methyltransferase SETMAR-like [Camponotus floridanus]|uniref:histone-lysine N-methyltransferase SETMAR-like n=1 Tax=Camponotus floridanus TaxID=104421 RepID=UPI000DC6BADB|nr:histone-lysine N-methyltransferase SETMAR-like [Camponotus floridanus]
MGNPAVKKRNGIMPIEIKNELDSALEDSSPSFSTVKKWAAEFKRGRSSIFDDERSGRPKTATNEEIIQKIHDSVLNDRRIKMRELSHIANISIDRVHNILHEHLHMKKLSARWVPRLLTVDQKRIRMNISQECLDMFERNSAEFLRRFITVDEIRIHYTPETKQQSKQWVEADRSPKKAKTVLSAGKVMATVFWDSQGVVFIDYLEKGKISGEYYAALLEHLNNAIKIKRPYLAKKKVLFHHDNVPAHTSSIAIAKLHELRFELLPHALYSPDLTAENFSNYPRIYSSAIWVAPD